MRLSVAEVAHAVGQTESYVRQHIHRKHLIAQKDGRHVYVALNEAIRWARERGHSFELPARAPATTGRENDRTARMTVLTWHAQGMTPQNLFTLVRHRRKDALGPWARQSDKAWISKDLGNELRMFSCDAPLEHCQSLVNHIFDSGTLEISGNEIKYALEPVPRRHWAYRDLRPLAEASVLSLFSRHSAEIVEYWNVTRKPHEAWLEKLGQLPNDLPRRLKRLGFPLDRRSERVGNLMIAAAADAISCDLTANHNQTLSLHVDADEMLSTAYRATVWAGHCGDEVFRQEVQVVPGQTMVRLETDVDHIGFAVHRGIDGQCIDLMEVFLIKDVSILGHIAFGPVLKLRNRQGRTVHEVNPFGHRSSINVKLDRDSQALDREVRQQWLIRRVWQRETAVRREHNFARFQPEEFDEAVRYFIRLLRKDSAQAQPIYLADPYFMHRPDGGKEDKLYLDMFAATTGQPLRILCCSKKEESTQAWWSKYPGPMVSHVRVRSFLKSGSGERGDLKREFHDRYLITPEREVIITHSINGWSKHGVTFVTIPYGVYRAEAERLWSLDIGVDGRPTKVIEII